MNKTDYLSFLEDIRDALGKIERYVAGMDYDTFAENELVIDAVLRNLEIIGEAAKNIPEDVRAEHPDIEWRRMIGLRNIVAHEYFGVDLRIIWEIIMRRLPETKPKIDTILKNLDDAR